MTITTNYEVVSLVSVIGVTYSSAMRFRPGEGQGAAQRFKRTLGMRVNCVLRVKLKPFAEPTDA